MIFIYWFHVQVLLDYEDVIHIPFYRDMVEDVNKEIRNIR